VGGKTIELIGGGGDRAVQGKSERGGVILRKGGKEPILAEGVKKIRRRSHYMGRVARGKKNLRVKGQVIP